MITEQKEIKLWHWLKNKLSKHPVDLQRIENTTGCGVPDVNGCYKGSEAWIELKVHVKGQVVLRKEQYAWLARRDSHDGNVMVIAHNTDDETVEIYLPPFSVRPWGGTAKYVAIDDEPEFTYDKSVGAAMLIKAIFN